MFRVFQTERCVRYENLPLKDNTGHLHEVEVVANLYREDTHEVVQCNIRDITERKRVDLELISTKEAIRRQTVELEDTIAQRTVQLRETIGELEAFSYSISHDMRAPLRAMRGFSELLLQNHARQLDAPGHAYLEKICAAAGRMDQLIQDVLSYTRVLRAEVQVAPVDLDFLVREIINTYPQLHTGDAEIHIMGVLPKALGAEASLAQGISNLLSNAVKFVPVETRPRVTIRAETIAGDVRLWVEDNGVGIAPEDQTRIFKMFERVDRATVYEGTGMGLAIVRKAVERMGGQLGVESEPGLGSKFWIQLKGIAV
jgi:signal transduction histidine kinase